MFGPLLIVILATIGVLALVAQSARGPVTGNKLAGFLTAAALLGLFAAFMLVRGKWFIALPGLAGAVACAQAYQKMARLQRRSQNPADMDEKEARAILGVSANASLEEIKSAHRKLIEQVHPDKGGNDYLAAQINLARDILLKAAP